MAACPAGVALLLSCLCLFQAQAATRIFTHNGSLVLNADAEVEFRVEGRGINMTFSQLLSLVATTGADAIAASQSFASGTVISNARAFSESTASTALATSLSATAVSRNVSASTAIASARGYTDTSLSALAPTLATRSDADGLSASVVSLSGAAVQASRAITTLNTSKADLSVVLAQLATKADATLVAAVQQSAAQQQTATATAVNTLNTTINVVQLSAAQQQTTTSAAVNTLSASMQALSTGLGSQVAGLAASTATQLAIKADASLVTAVQQSVAQQQTATATAVNLLNSSITSTSTALQTHATVMTTQITSMATATTGQLATKADASLVATVQLSAAAQQTATNTAVNTLNTTVAAVQASVALQQSTVAMASATVATLVNSLNVSIGGPSTTIQSLSTSVNSQLSAISNTVASLAARTATLEGQLAIMRTCALLGGTPIDTNATGPLSAVCMLPSCKGVPTSGVYTIRLPGASPQLPEDIFPAYCRVDADGSRWLIFQRRTDATDFFLGWASYVAGFGNVTTNNVNGPSYWLGLERLYRLTSLTGQTWRLRVDLLDPNSGSTGFESYSTFSIGSSATNYVLGVSEGTGSVGDSLFPTHNGRPFSTKDFDNDATSANCALIYKSGWWMNACHSSNLNGVYYNGCHTSYADGVNWYTWNPFICPTSGGTVAQTGHYNSLRSWMMIAPV